MLAPNLQKRKLEKRGLRTSLRPHSQALARQPDQHARHCWTVLGFEMSFRNTDITILDSERPFLLDKG